MDELFLTPVAGFHIPFIYLLTYFWPYWGLRGSSLSDRYQSHAPCSGNTGPPGKSPEGEFVYWSLLTLPAEPGPRRGAPGALAPCRDRTAGQAPLCAVFPPGCPAFKQGRQTQQQAESGGEPPWPGRPVCAASRGAQSFSPGVFWEDLH